MTASTQRETAARDSVLARFMLGFEGNALTDELKSYLARGLSGVAIYGRNFHNLAGLRKLTTAIREAARRPILIGIDQEGGNRFALKEPFTLWPSATDLGRLADTKLVERVAHAMGLEVRAAGCNLNFAPMLDLHVNRDSPVTKDRSFGADPHLVAKMGVAFDRGLRAGGVLSCAKHFPGHGDAQVDPHIDLPVFHGTRERLESQELVPFATAITCGTPIIMTAHIMLPQIDPDLPASLSRKMLGEILRQRLGFGGVILADDLGMGAIARRFSPGDASNRALQAGTDIVMLCHDWPTVAPTISAVARAFGERRFDKSEWQASLMRINRVCALAGSNEPPPLEIIGCEEHRALAAEVRVRLSPLSP
jgi:beta-N-acetylhexosaminidase